MPFLKGKKKKRMILQYYTNALYKHTDMWEGTDTLSEGICRVSVRHFRSVENCGDWNKR